jgi:hypothetical protein
MLGIMNMTIMRSRHNAFCFNSISEEAYKVSPNEFAVGAKVRYLQLAATKTSDFHFQMLQD